MTKFLKIAVTAAVFALGVAPLAGVSASEGDHASCQSSQFTQHGVWDCR